MPAERWRRCCGRRCAALPLERVLSPPADIFAQWPLEPTVAALLQAAPQPAVIATGTPSEPALIALGGARWALRSAESFRDGALRAANLGGDADVTTAVYGAARRSDAAASRRFPRAGSRAWRRGRRSRSSRIGC